MSTVDFFTFEAQLLRLKNTLLVKSDMEAASALGLSKQALSIRKRRGSFPADRLRAMAPSLGIDPEFVLHGTGLPAALAPQTTAEEDDFTPPTFEEMAAYMDAEMARMGIPPQGAAA